MTHDPQDIRRPTKTTHDTRPSSPSAKKTDYNTPCVFGVTPTQGPTPHPLSYYYMPQRVNLWAHGRFLVVLGSARDPRTILEPPSGPPLNPSGPSPGPTTEAQNQRNLAKLESGPPPSPGRSQNPNPPGSGPTQQAFERALPRNRQK